VRHEGGRRGLFRLERVIVGAIVEGKGELLGEGALRQCLVLLNVSDMAAAT
jgi:hypothetical protein